MNSIWKNSFLFVLPTFLIGTIKGLYTVYVQGIVDSKFSEPFTMFQVHVGAAFLVSVFLFVSFFVLSFISGKLTNLKISNKGAFVIGTVVCALTYAYGETRYNMYQMTYDPRDVGNILLAILFVGLNIKQKMLRPKP